MVYLVTDYGTNIMGNNIVVLGYYPWDDHGFKTSFFVAYYDNNGDCHSLGNLKIARIDAPNDNTYKAKSDLPETFEQLPEQFCSLWQSAEDYKTIYDVFVSKGINIFEDLRDISYDIDLFNSCKNSDVVKISLMRYVTDHTVKKQFHRISQGQSELVSYYFIYKFFNHSDLVDDMVLRFDAVPDSFPPTNVHCLIGLNGSGKTTLIKSMIESIYGEDRNGTFLYDDANETDYFESLVCVSFSPFDDFEKLAAFSTDSLEYNGKKDKFVYIGVKKHYSSKEENKEIDLLQSIEHDYLESLEACLKNNSKKRDLIDMLSIFINRGINPIGCSIIELSDCTPGDIKKYIKLSKNAFGMLSAGHKSVLSILTRCVDKVAEKTILFMDEPENHLHPPLLSDLIRNISELLKKRNGVAIISTHSPIVLQEVPSSCVWKIIRKGSYVAADRIKRQTFGANIGVLTNDVFEHELENSGFVSLLRKEVENGLDYDSIVAKYNNQLGEEAKSALRVMLADNRED